MADASPLTVVIDDPDNSVRVDHDSGNIETDTPDGGVVIQFGGARKEKDKGGFYENLAEKIDPGKLATIANDLIECITKDDESRSQYLQTVRRGLELMGLKLEEPRSSVDDSGSSMDGVSSVTNPLLLEACLKTWANARAELLPSEGPAKIMIQGDEDHNQDDLANALERDFNYFLTEIATEYYPDTSHMLLWGPIFRGSGFKKIYRDPMKRRPTSESVGAEDLIVSDATKDFRTCARITHQIKMRPSVMKRMKLVGAYRDVALGQPTPTQGVVETQIGEMQGVRPQPQRPEDQPYTIWETQCELDISEYSPDGFKNEGIPLPYFVAIDKDSREILQLRRDWREDDDLCQRRRLYVKYPYVPGPGFYGTGMLQILGNSAAAMTAAWREALDAEMLASFPGGFIDKLASRQNTSNLRAGPGDFVPIDTQGRPIQQMVMPFPYKGMNPGLLALMQQIEAQSKELSGSAEIPAGEGLANIPVGTMLAQIEQATKIMSASHKDMCEAQAEEFKMLIDLFRENPEDFWRGNKETPLDFWDEQKLIQALNDHKLIPRADPNTPSHIHRVMKAVAYANIIQIPQLAPFFNPKQIAEMIVRALKDNPIGIVIDPPPAQGGEPPSQMIMAQAKMTDAQAKMQNVQVQASKVQTDASSKKDDAAIRAAQLAAEQQIENTRLQKEEIIHQNDRLKTQHDASMDQASHGLDVSQHELEASKMAHEAQMAEKEHELNVFEAMKPEPPKKAK